MHICQLSEVFTYNCIRTYGISDEMQQGTFLAVTLSEISSGMYLF